MTAQAHIRFLGMNAIDLLLFGCAVVILFFYAAAELGFKDLKKPLGCVLLLTPILFLAAQSATGFLTIDAAFNIFPEITDLPSSEMVQFRLGAFRTSEMLLGPLVWFLKFIVTTPYRLAMVLKGIHWMAGFLLLLWIHRISRRLVTGGKTTYFIVYMFAALTLPTNLLALKVFNYDKLSLLLGTLGLVYMICAWVELRRGAAATGLICLSLAAQEKLIASPFLWLAMPVFAWLVASRFGPGPARRCRWMLGSAFAVLIVLGVSVLTYLEMAVLRGSLTGLPPVTVLKPLEGILWPFLKSAMAVSSTGAAVLLICLSFLITTGGALGLQGWKVSDRCRDWGDRFSEKSFRTVYGVAGAMLTVGIVWRLMGEIYLGPIQPVTPGHYLPGTTFNETFWHFDAQTYPGHLLRLVMADAAIFVHALPSAFWLALASLAWLEWRSDGNFARRQPGIIVLAAVSLGMLFAPLFYAVTQTPATPRYFNLFIFCFVLTVLIRVNPYLETPGRKTAALCIMLVLSVVELVPFRPVYGAYAPLWTRAFDADFNRTFTPGRMGAISRWPGWGEEVMLAGRLIEKSCAPNRCDAINLFVAYPGIWLDARYISRQRIYPIDSHHVDYTENDYFVVNRASIIQNWNNFPQGIAPYAVIDFGNYVQAYVYRGDVLNRADFRFQSVSQQAAP